MIDRGKPKMVVSDNGSELTSNAILAWADASRLDWHYIAPGQANADGWSAAFSTAFGLSGLVRHRQVAAA